MQNDSQQPPGLGQVIVPPPPVPPPPASFEPEPRKLLAPLWHTVLLVLVMLGNSAITAFVATRTKAHGAAISSADRYVSYVVSIFLELFLLGLLWVGLRIYNTRIRDLIGGRWDSFEDFLLDVAVAIGFWVASYVVLLGIGWLMGMVKPSQIEDTKKLAQLLAPHSWGALAVFVCLSATAGFVEEIIFRGYLQRQIGALTGNIYVGLVISAAIFGAGHGYEGTRRMVLIFFFGMMFGVLALARKSLRPGMMAHAWFDAFQGVLLFVASRTGILTTH